MTAARISDSGDDDCIGDVCMGEDQVRDDSLLDSRPWQVYYAYQIRYDSLLGSRPSFQVLVRPDGLTAVGPRKRNQAGCRLDRG